MTTAIQLLTPAMVSRAYDGRPGCMCGCKGKYWTNPAQREQAGKEQGYEVAEAECSMPEVTRILRIIQAADAGLHHRARHPDDDAGLAIFEDGVASAEVGARVYTVYLITSEMA